MALPLDVYGVAAEMIEERVRARTAE